MARRIDCGDDGCGQCQVCRYLDFLEYARNVGGGEPHHVERNLKLDAILEKKGIRV